MKTIIPYTLGLIFLGFLASCNGLRGNGHVVKQDRTVSPFTKITVDGVLPAEISQDGGAEWVKVQTDDNLQHLILVKNDGDELIITTDKGATFRNATKMKILINVKNLKELEFSSVGNLTTSGTLKLDSLEINSESVGKIDMNIEADFLRANLKSVGGTTLRGKVGEARINNSRVGSLSAFGLKTRVIMLHNTAVGSAEIYSDSAFYIRSSAVGTVYYKGPGVVKELTSDGVGRIQKKED